MKRQRIPGMPATRPGRVAYLLPEIQDAAPAWVKNALAVRNAASTSGVCPDCGCRGELRRTATLGVYRVTFRHEADCSALCDPEAA